MKSSFPKGGGQTVVAFVAYVVRPIISGFKMKVRPSDRSGIKVCGNEVSGRYALTVHEKFIGFIEIQVKMGVERDQLAEQEAIPIDDILGDGQVLSVFRSVLHGGDTATVGGIDGDVGFTVSDVQIDGGMMFLRTVGVLTV